MPGLRIQIDTSAAQRASAQLRSELTRLGSSAATNAQEFQRLEQRMLNGMGTAGAQRSLQNLQQSLNMTRLETARFRASLGDFGGAFSTLTQGMGGAISGFATLKTAIAGVAAAIGAGAIASSFLETAKMFEKFEIQLKTLTGSSAQAKESMSWIQNFAKTTPYELDQVTESFIKLQSYGMDSTKWLKTLGDTASGMGKSLDQAVEMFADAATGEFERLKEFGVKAKKEGDTVSFSWSQNGRDMVMSAEATQSGITTALGEIFQRFDGSMDAMSQSWEGMTSNISDIWTAFQKEVMDSGPFVAMKAGLKEFLDYLNSSKGQLSMKEWAQDSATFVLDMFETMISGAQLFMDAIAGIRLAFGSVAKIYSSLMVSRYENKIQLGTTDVFDLASKEEISELTAKLADAKNMYAAATMMVDANSQAIVDNSSKFAELKSKIDGWRTSTKTATEETQAATAAIETQGKKTAEAAEEPIKKTKELAKAGREAQQEIAKAAKEHEQVLSNFLQDYMKATMSDADFQQAQLDAQLKEYDRHVKDKDALNRWYAAEFKKIEDKRLKESDSALKDYFDEIDDLEKDLTKTYQDEQEKRAKDLQDALEDQRRAYEDFVADIEYGTANFLEDWMRSGFSSAMDGMEDDFSSMLTRLAAQAISKPIIVPIIQSIGGVLGGNLSSSLGIVGSTATTSGFNLSNIPGLVNALSGGMETGVYNALTSGIFGSVGSSIFGGAAWSGTIGAELGWGATAAATTGMSTAGIAGAIAAAAPWAALAAAAVPIVMGMLESDPEPFIRVQTTSTSKGFTSGDYNWGVGEGVSPSGYDYNLTMQDTADETRKQLSTAITKMLDLQFQTIEDTLSVSVNDAIVAAQTDAGQYGAGFFSKIDLTQYKDNIEGALTALSDDLFGDIQSYLVDQLAGTGSSSIFNSDFFSSISADGETVVDTFLRFGQVVQSTDNFMDEFTRQVNEFGESTTQAYANVQTISEVMDQISTAAADFADNSSISALEEIDATYQGLIETLKSANAATVDLEKAESFRVQELGAQISGLTSTSVASALWDSIKNAGDAETFVGSLEEQVRYGVAQAAVNAFSESLYSAFLGPMNSAIGGMVSQIISGGMTTGAALTASMATIKDSLDAALALMKNEDFKSLIGTFMGEVSALMPTTPVVAATTIPTADTSYTPSTTVAVDTTAEETAAKLTDMMSNIRNAISDSMLDEYAAQIAQINRDTQDSISSAVELGATERDLADIREWGSIQITQVLDEQASQLSDTMQKIRESISDSGMSDYVQKLSEISREMEDNISTAIKLGATEQELTEIRELATIKTQDVIDAFYDSVVSLAAVQEKINRASSIVDDQVLYYQLANLFDLPYDQIAKYSKQQLIDAFMKTDSLTWAATLEQMGINVDDFTALMSKLVDSLAADTDRIESLYSLQSDILGQADQYTSQSRKEALSRILKYDMTSFSDADIVNMYGNLSKDQLKSYAEWLGSNTDEFVQVMREISDSVKNTTKDLAQSRLDLEYAISSAFGTVSSRSFTDIVSAKGLDTRTIEILSGIQHEIEYGAINADAARQTYDNLAGALESGTIGLEDFNSAIDLVVENIKNADGLQAFQIAMAKESDNISIANARYLQASEQYALTDKINDLVSAMNDHTVITDELVDASSELIGSFSGVASAAASLAYAGAAAASTLLENLGGLFSSGLEESGYSPDSKIDDFIASLRERIKVANDEAMNIWTSSISPSVNAQSALENERMKLEQQRNTYVELAPEYEILTNAINSATNEINGLNAAITVASEAIAKPQSIISTISAATDKFETIINEQKALPLAENQAILDLFYQQTKSSELPLEALAKIGDVQKGNEDSYASALSGLIDLFSNESISQEIFNTTFDIATKLFSGEIIPDLEDKVLEVKNAVKSIFETIFETVSGVLTTPLEKAKYDILTQANEWIDALKVQQETFNKLPANSSSDYLAMAEALNISHSVIDKWVKLKFALLDIDEMNIIGNSRAAIKGTTASFNLESLAKDFADISRISEQQKIYSKYMTASWSEIQAWMDKLGYSADEFSTAMQTIVTSLQRVQAVSEGKAAILGKTSEYQLIKNAIQWGLPANTFDSRDKQQEQINWFLNSSAQDIVEWTDKMGLDTSEFITNIQDMASNLKETNKTFEDIVKTLEDYKQTLLDSNKALSPDVSYKQKMSDWNSNLANVYSSDPDKTKEGISRFATLSNALLVAGASSMTDQYEYNRLWGKIYAETEKARIHAEEQMTQSIDEFEVTQENWKDLLELTETTTSSTNELLLQNNELQVIAQAELETQTTMLIEETRKLAKSEDFDTFFNNFNSLFSDSASWMLSLKGSIVSVYDAIESEKLLFDPLSSLLASIDTTLTSILNKDTDSPATQATISNYYYGGHDDPAQDAYALMFHRMGIPGYASGGYHEGGLAIAGELGPELINVGPSRIFSNNDTKKIFDTSEIVKELKKLRSENEEMKALLSLISSDGEKTKKTLMEWKEQGFAPTEA